MEFSRYGEQVNRISEVTRRNILDQLLLWRGDFHGRMGVIEFLDRIWTLAEMPAVDRREPNLRADLQRHYVHWGDYNDAQVLFDILRITRCPDDQFGRFLALCLHPLVRADAGERGELLTIFNSQLAADGFVLAETSRISGHPVFEMTTIGSPMAVKAERYDVALSFAGEQRYYVDAVAGALEAAGIAVFYDRFEEAYLWGEDLTEVLESVFLHGARFVVMFSSAEYGAKMWPTYERRVAVERAMTKQEAYILPVRFDDTKIPGIRETVGYQDARVKSPAEIANLIRKKLERPAS
jgi:hypothetical protein